MVLPVAVMMSHPFQSMHVYTIVRLEHADLPLISMHAGSHVVCMLDHTNLTMCGTVSLHEACCMVHAPAHPSTCYSVMSCSEAVSTLRASR